MTVAGLRAARARTALFAAVLIAGGKGHITAQEPARLDRIVVTATAERCPVPDQLEAHELWKAMAAHYSPALSQLSRDAWIQRDGGWAQGSVLAEDLGSFSAAEVAATRGGGVRSAVRDHSMGGPFGVPARKRYDSHEYATRIPDDEPRLLYQPWFLNWYYQRLDEDFIDHFIDGAFDSRHDMGLRTVAGGAALVFCGRDHRQPWIEGAMDITRDTLLAHVMWRYVTPRPLEDAAAEVWLDLDGPVRRGSRQLWPDRTIFYRRASGANAWFQEAWINVVTCAWNTQAAALAGEVPVMESRDTGCTAGARRLLDQRRSQVASDVSSLRDEE